MNNQNLFLTPDDIQTIHSSIRLPQNMSKNSTRLSLDSKNQMLIKGIYWKAPKTPQTNITIIQSNLSYSDKKFLTTPTATSIEKTLKTQETQPEEKYPFKISELVNRKKTLTSVTLRTRTKEEAQAIAENDKNTVKKYKFLSYDTNKCNNLIENSTKDQEIDNPQYYFNANFIPKKNWFHYPRTSIIKRHNKSFFQRNVNSPSTLTHPSIASNPLKPKSGLESSSINPKLKESQLKPQAKRKESKENGNLNIFANPTEKISRMFEKNFVDNLNKMVSNPEIPLPPLDLKIKQANLKEESNILKDSNKFEIGRLAKTAKVLELQENAKNELDSIVKTIEQKYQKLLREEQIYQEYENQNEDKDSFTRGFIRINKSHK